MREISNSTLALLVVMAIVVSVAGTFVSLGKLNQLGGGGIAGFIVYNTTNTGVANLTVPCSVYFNLSDSLIQLGTIHIQERNTSDVVNDWWYLQNDGSTNITIEITNYHDASTTSGLQGYSSSVPGGGIHQNRTGIGPFASQSPVPTSAVPDTGVGMNCLAHWTRWITMNNVSDCFMVKCNSTQSGKDCNNSYYPLPNATGYMQFLIDLSPQDDIDQAVFGVNVTVPPGEIAGNKQQVINFYSTASEVCTS